MKDATSAVTVQYLKQLIAQLGISETIVSDNCRQFLAAEFKEVCQMNGIRHVQTAPYHFSSNRVVERAIQVFTQGIHKQSTSTIHDKMEGILFQYLITLYSTTGMSLTEMLLGKRPCCCLDLLEPNIEQKVIEKQKQQKPIHNSHCCECSFWKGRSCFLETNKRKEMATRLNCQ